MKQYIFEEAVDDQNGKRLGNLCRCLLFCHNFCSFGSDSEWILGRLSHLMNRSPPTHCQNLCYNQNQPRTRGNDGGRDTGRSEFRFGEPGGADKAPFSDCEQESMRLNYKKLICGNRGGGDVR